MEMQINVEEKDLMYNEIYLGRHSLVESLWYTSGRYGIDGSDQTLSVVWALECGYTWQGILYIVENISVYSCPFVVYYE